MSIMCSIKWREWTVYGLIEKGRKSKNIERQTTDFLIFFSNLAVLLDLLPVTCHAETFEYSVMMYWDEYSIQLNWSRFLMLREKP